MSITTISSEYKNLTGWTPTVSCLQRWSEGREIQAKEEMKPCGCGVKLDLQDVVYPALKRTSQEVSLEGVLGFSKRVDAHVHPGRLALVKRCLVPKRNLAARSDEISEELAKFGGDSVIELFSTSLDYFEDREAMRGEFSELVELKARMLSAAAVRAREIHGSQHMLHFGKGHSIRAGGDFFMFDFLRHSSDRGYSVANNDTIITADSMVKHHCAISVFTALNNALNDLFLMGVTEDLVLLPVYDGEPSEVQAIRAALADFTRFFAERGVSLDLRDFGPLGIDAKMIGATVIGQARHELPDHSGLIPGQEILATRLLGDLSFLSMHRGLHFPHQPHPEMDQIRWEVLQRFCTPNFLAARVIRSYLPELGEKFDRNKHITFSSDVSGPGLFVLEEAARTSGVDVYIGDM